MVSSEARPTAWEMWTEFIIPLLGVISSFAIAAAAVGVTIWIARREVAERVRQRRLEWIRQLDKFMTATTFAPDGKSQQADVDELLLEISVAAVGAGETKEVRDWLNDQTRQMYEELSWAEIPGPLKSFLWTNGTFWIHDALVKWADTGRWQDPGERPTKQWVDQ